MVSDFFRLVSIWNKKHVPYAFLSPPVSVLAPYIYLGLVTSLIQRLFITYVKSILESE